MDGEGEGWDAFVGWSSPLPSPFHLLRCGYSLISMSWAWRQGMGTQVKDRVVGLLCSQQRGELREYHLKYLRHSQFFKVCLNKMGSRNPHIDTHFLTQQQYLTQVAQQLTALRSNISGFMFAFTTPPSHHPIITPIPPPSSSLQQFKNTLDSFIERTIGSILLQLQEQYSPQRLKQLRTEMEQLMGGESEGAVEEGRQQWEGVVTEAFNFNCLQKVVTDVLATHHAITTFKSDFSQKNIALHGQQVLNSLFDYSLDHRETEMNGERP